MGSTVCSALHESDHLPYGAVENKALLDALSKALKLDFFGGSDKEHSGAGAGNETLGGGSSNPLTDLVKELDQEGSGSSIGGALAHSLHLLPETVPGVGGSLTITLSDHTQISFTTISDISKLIH